MKITRALHWTEHLALTRPYTIAYKTIDSVDNHFVRLDSDDGSYGLGAAAPSASVTGERMADCSAALERCLAPLLEGEDIRHLKLLARRLAEAMPSAPAARAAVDMALYDLMAKYLDIPLTDMLGRAHQCLPTSITIGIKSITASLAEAREYVQRGFRILKVKIGRALDEDVECLFRIREQVGPETAIRVDANQGYGPDDFRSFSRQTRPLGLEFVEQPLKAGDMALMRALPEDVRLKSAGDESVCSVEDALACTHPPAPFGIYNIKLMKCGGITPGLQIAEIAHLAGIDLMWGCMDESVVSISAALHAALASPATRYLDLDGSLDLARDLVKGGFVIENGVMRPTRAPGLGVALS